MRSRAQTDAKLEKVTCLSAPQMGLGLCRRESGRRKERRGEAGGCRKAPVVAQVEGGCLVVRPAVRNWQTVELIK